MSDDHTQGTELEDVIRRAEEQLESKLAELRQMRSVAPGDTEAVVDPVDEVPLVDAVMRPVAIPDQSTLDGAWDEGASAWDDEHSAIDEDIDSGVEVDVLAQDSLAPLAPVNEWSEVADQSDENVDDVAMLRPTAGSAAWSDGPVFDATSGDGSDIGWGADRDQYSSVSAADEQAFWAQTRSALRSLQQATDDMVPEVATVVSSRIERVVRDEMREPVDAVRSMQQVLPEHVERIENTVAAEVQQPVEMLRLLNESIPRQLDAMERSIQTVIETNVSTYSSSIGDRLELVATRLDDGVDRVERRVHDDVSHVEQVLAANVTRMTQGLVQQVTKVERDLSEGFERQRHGAQSDVQRLEQTVRDEFEAPTAMLRQIQDELPARFGRSDRLQQQVADTLRDELLPVRRYVGQLSELGAHTAILETARVSQLTADQLGVIGASFDQDRLQRAADLELMLDSMTSGWKGLYGSVETLLARVDAFDQRMTRLEGRLDALGKLEPSMHGALASLQERLDQSIASMEARIVQQLPAPVTVTVSHPEVHVAEQPTGGFIFEGQE